MHRVQPITLPTNSGSHTPADIHTAHSSGYAAADFATPKHDDTHKPAPRLRSPGRAFRDPAAVGAFLAQEGALSRIQAKHRAYVDRDRDSDEEEGALEDAFLRGLGGMAQAESIKEE